MASEEGNLAKQVEKLSAKLAVARKKCDNAKARVEQLEAELKIENEAKRKLDEGLASKETELASAKQSAEQESKKANS